MKKNESEIMIINNNHLTTILAILVRLWSRTIQIGQKWLINIGQIGALVTIGGIGHKMVVLDYCNGQANDQTIYHDLSDSWKWPA